MNAFKFLALAFCVPCLAMAQQQEQTTPGVAPLGTETRSQQSAHFEEEIRRDERNLIKLEAHQKAIEQLQTQASSDREDLITAKLAAQEARERSAIVISVMEYSIACLGIIFTIAAIGGFWELRRIQGLRKKVKEQLTVSSKLSTDVGEQLHRAEEASDAIQRLRDQIHQKWQTGPKAFEILALIKSMGSVTGSKKSLVTDEMRASCEDLDTLAVVGDKLLVDGVEARVFIDLARYWRARFDYPKALLRVNRALSIEPDSFSGALEKAKILSQSVAFGRSDEKPRKYGPDPLLTDALQLIDGQLGKSSAANCTSREQHRDLLQTKAWILDEQGDFAQAAKLLEEALRIDQLLIAECNSPKEFPVHYNYVCSLIKAGQREKGLDELEKFSEFSAIYKKIPDDDDFAVIRADPILGKRLAQILHEAEARAENPARTALS